MLLNYKGKFVPTTLEELVKTAHTALVMIDIQNDFCAPGGLYSKVNRTLTRGDQVVKNTKLVLEQARRSGVLPVFIQNTTLQNGLSDSPAWIRFRMRSYNSPDPALIMENTVEGTWGWEVVDELRPLPGELRVRKNRSSAFHNTNLDLVLKSNGIQTLVVTGVVTQGCVESTARDAVFHDFFVVVLDDCVDTFSRELHEASMKIMATRFDIIHSSDLLALWSQAVNENASKTIAVQAP
jgi:nicotinamidase-related amidase